MQVLNRRKHFCDSPLFGLYEDSKGVCNGSVIDSVYKYVFSLLVKGCEVVSAME